MTYLPQERVESFQVNFLMVDLLFDLLLCLIQLSDTDFQEYSFTAGVTDDGIGEPLPEFSQFQIKIVMQSTDAANPPRIKDLRAIALAT